MYEVTKYVVYNGQMRKTCDKTAIGGYKPQKQEEVQKPAYQFIRVYTSR